MRTSEIHSHRGQTFPGSRYAGVALFERLAGEFGLLFDLHPVFGHQRRHYRYAFSFEEPEKIIIFLAGETPAIGYIAAKTRTVSPGKPWHLKKEFGVHDRVR